MAPIVVRVRLFHLLYGLSGGPVRQLAAESVFDISTASRYEDRS
jgi:hypothetical protein